MNLTPYPATIYRAWNAAVMDLPVPFPFLVT
jgi:hypothetical protein